MVAIAIYRGMGITITHREYSRQIDDYITTDVLVDGYMHKEVAYLPLSTDVHYDDVIRCDNHPSIRVNDIIYTKSFIKCKGTIEPVKEG